MPATLSSVAVTVVRDTKYLLNQTSQILTAVKVFSVCLWSCVSSSEAIQVLLPRVLHVNK